MLRKIFLITFLLASFFLVSATSLLAEWKSFEKSTGLNKTADKDTGAGYDTTADTGAMALSEKIGGIIGIILSFLGVAFLLLIMYGGYTWMTARGNEQEVEKAKSLIKNAVVGLIIVLAAYAITVFAGSQIGDKRINIV